jgi:ATP-binding cassette subfamily F protein 3
MEKIAPLLAEADFSFEFRPPASLPNPMLSLQEVSVGYPPAQGGSEPAVIVRGISKSVLAGQRIGILGANGQGKSTLVKTIARALLPLAGQMIEGKGLSIGYFAQQELDVLKPADNPLEHMIALAKETAAAGRLAGQETREQDLRNFLGMFNFGGDMVKQTVGSMSGGEKARLVLCMLVWQRPNLLLLDEPTNHLDLATREALSVALNEFEGTVMLVSHDRALLRAVCDEFWLVSRGGVKPFDGDLDDYQRYLLDEAKRAREKGRSDANEKPASRPSVVGGDVGDGGDGGSKFSGATSGIAAQSLSQQRARDKQTQQEWLAAVRPLKKQLQQVEAELGIQQAEQTRLHDLVSRSLAPAELAQAGRQLKDVEQALAQLEERWLDLSEQIERCG